jgi:hypothetical protein
MLKIRALSVLKNLSSLEISIENSIVKLCLFRPFTLFCIPSLTQLNGTMANSVEIALAIDRFRM